MPSCRLSAKRSGSGRFGGKLICFCKQQSMTYSIPEEVCCSNFTGEMLKSWKMVYKPSSEVPSAQKCSFSRDDDLSTPSGLANFYRKLINTFGFKTAAFALEVAKC